MAIYVGKNKVSRIYAGKQEITNIFTNKLSVGNTVTGAATISDISTLNYVAARSYTGDSYPISRYGGAFFYPKDDGTRLLYTYADYDYHSQRYVDLSTPWDFSTVGSSTASPGINLSNHYQTTWYITSDGTRIFTGGYSNSNASGWDDIYQGSPSTAWDPTSVTWTTYGTNPRSSWNAHTSYTILGWKDDGTKWLMGTTVNASGTQNNYYQYIKEFSTSTAWDQTASNQTLVNTFDLGNALGVSSYYVSGNGTTVGVRAMNRAGTQIIAQTVDYTSSSITAYKFYLVNLSTPFDVSTATVDSSKYLDLASVHAAGSNFGINDVKFGKDDLEIIVGQGSGTYGTANGIKGRWLVYA